MEFIRRFWESRGSEHGSAPSASWEDTGCIALEIETLADILPHRARLLDVGCANGHATFEIAPRVEAAEVVGVDYSEKMIEAARRRLIEERRAKEERLSGGDETPAIPMRFEVADVRNLPFDDHVFDAVYGTRVLINLPTWEEQQGAIEQMLRVCRPGGRVVLMEAFYEPLARLNAARLVAGLAPLCEHDFNRYLKEGRLASWLKTKGLSFSVRPFSGLYYVGTRLLRELVCDERIEGYRSPLHDAFLDIERRYDVAPFSVQQAVIIERS